jgi:hypothetical protein
VTPEQVGLHSYGRRQVPGLRREEVASLAGVSVDYYRRLERGDAAGVSPQRIRPVVQRIVDSISSPATVSNMRGDYLAANALGRALYAPLFESSERPANSARFTFLDPAAQQFFTDWEKSAKDLVAHLRSEAGRNPHDRALTDLIGELSTRSERRSESGGPPTTSATTRPAASGSITRPSATSSSSTRSWSSRPTAACAWQCSPQNPAPAQPKHSSSWQAGPPHQKLAPGRDPAFVAAYRPPVNVVPIFPSRCRNPSPGKGRPVDSASP